MFCDCCGDLVVAAKPIKIIFPDNSKLEILICLECWWEKFEGKSRKLQVARILKILLDEE
jgi:RNase P subunit RPR2